jgi:hypothetical protein
MKKNWIHRLPLLLAFAFLGIIPAQAQEKTSATTPVKMTVTLNVLGENKRTPEVSREDVIVRQGHSRLEVTGWEPLREGNTGRDLFILIDDASNPIVGSQFDDLRSFINGQPPNTKVGVGYMRNGTVQIAQDLTSDHNQAAKALRLPMASSGAYGSPYLSVIDLMKRWPDDSQRREVVMMTDGIDRFRSTQRFRGLRTPSPDVDSASRVAQRTGTTINSIFTRGVGRLSNNFWEITNGQNGMAKLAEETGGQSFYLGPQNPVSFKPYLDELQKGFDNKYVLEFRAIPGQNSGPQYVKLSTEVAGVELNSADSVWVNAR